MNYILLFGMPGGGELFFIVLIVIMLFGSKKIPELARGLGKGMREIKNATGDIQREIQEGVKDISNIKESVDVKRKVSDLMAGETEVKKQPEMDEESIQEPQAVKRRSAFKADDSEPTSEPI